MSADEFAQVLLQSGLVSSEEINEARGVLSPSEADANALARRLVESGRLTEYQVQLLRELRFADLVIGNYEVLDRIGAGGMGAVFKARHRRMKRVVALKLLASNRVRDPSFVQRFQREIETIAQLSHPNIVMAFDADVADAGHFLVMEYVAGRDLDSLVTKGGALSVAAAVDCVAQAARGLEYAHGRGFIHRDIKPANLLRDAAGVVKVTDLGLARLRNTGEAGGITQAGGILGTVDFMPPEQAIDATQIDYRADIYSLGATLYFLLTGMPPYPERSLAAALLKHRDAPIPSLTKVRAEVPAALDALFRRMMAKAPADRCQSMTEVVRTLESVLATTSDPAALHATGPLPAADGAGAETVVPGPKTPAGAAPIQEETVQTVVAGKPRVANGGAGKVLLVEPSRVQSGIIRRYLEGQGSPQVVAVASGKDALAAIAAEQPAAVVCAMHLSDMTGVQLARQIRAEGRAAPGFVLISSEADDAEADSLSKYGNGMVLRKPFTPEQLGEALKLVAARPAAKLAAGRDRLRVLIVDDSAAARLHVRAVLQGLGLEQFLEAVDGAQAVALVARERFDLIVTDYNMPFMDGRGLVGYLRQNPATAGTPVIMVTTETDAEKLDGVRRLGVTVCDKSFPANVVERVLDKL
ncbi:MAG: response regulator [Gemmataceae bacterium]